MLSERADRNRRSSGQSAPDRLSRAKICSRSASPIPVTVFFPPKYSNTLNPETYTLATNDFIVKKNGIKMFTCAALCARRQPALSRNRQRHDPDCHHRQPQGTKGKRFSGMPNSCIRTNSKTAMSRKSCLNRTMTMIDVQPHLARRLFAQPLPQLHEPLPPLHPQNKSSP